MFAELNFALHELINYFYLLIELVVCIDILSLIIAKC